MAGHSKWANIKHRKAGQDAKKAKVFTKIIRELTVAARINGNVEDNPRLRAAVDKALGSNMSRDTIDRAIARGAGNQDDQSLDEITYEGYGPSGVAILVETMTDNRNRTVAEVRHAFSKRGGNLGTDGSVAYLFSKKGQITFAPGANEEKIMEAALEAGAEDVLNNDDGSIDVITEPDQFSEVCTAFRQQELVYDNAEVTMIPSTYSDLDQETAVKVLALIDHLEDLDDVQNVYSNANFPDDFDDES